jgi:hypothetical protein
LVDATGLGTLLDAGALASGAVVAGGAAVAGGAVVALLLQADATKLKTATIAAKLRFIEIRSFCRCW